jgi:hypothetical protein
MFSFIMLLSSIAFADEHGEKSMAQRIVVEKAWARETFKMARSGAAYATFSNPSESAIKIMSASVDASVAGMVELHTTEMMNGMMRMQELDKGVTIASGETATLQPGGMHFMIMGLNGPLQASKRFSITLTFADDSEKAIDVVVQDMSNRKATQ